jgi:hypothetical protein
METASAKGDANNNWTQSKTKKIGSTPALQKKFVRTEQPGRGFLQRK